MQFSVGKHVQKGDIWVAHFLNAFWKHYISVKKNTIFIENILFQRTSILFAKNKKMRDAIPSNFPAVARPDLCSKAQW